MAKSLRLDRGQIEVVDDKVADILRRKTPGERIQIACDLWVSVQRMLITHLRQTHPEWDSKKVEQEVARRLSHGAVELLQKVTEVFERNQIEKD